MSKLMNDNSAALFVGGHNAGKKMFVPRGMRYIELPVKLSESITKQRFGEDSGLSINSVATEIYTLVGTSTDGTMSVYAADAVVQTGELTGQGAKTVAVLMRTLPRRKNNKQEIKNLSDQIARTVYHMALKEHNLE